MQNLLERSTATSSPTRAVPAPSRTATGPTASTIARLRTRLVSGEARIDRRARRPAAGLPCPGCGEAVAEAEQPARPLPLASTCLRRYELRLRLPELRARHSTIARMSDTANVDLPQLRAGQCSRQSKSAFGAGAATSDRNAVQERRCPRAARSGTRPPAGCCSPRECAAAHLHARPPAR